MIEYLERSAEAVVVSFVMFKRVSSISIQVREREKEKRCGQMTRYNVCLAI